MAHPSPWARSAFRDCTVSSVATDAPVPTSGQITVTIAGGGQTEAVNGTYYYQSDPPPQGSVVINEIETQGSPDWIELYNPSSLPIDLGGWTLTDDNPLGNGNKLTIPDGTVLNGGDFLVYQTKNEPADPSADFGLSDIDRIDLKDPQGNPVSFHDWDTHPSSSWGLCPDGENLPNGSGDYKNTFIETRGAPNNCVQVGVVAEPGTFNLGDLSGLDFEPPSADVLWAVIDNGRLYRLTKSVDNGLWERPASGDWKDGKELGFFNDADSAGEVDAEGVTFAADSAKLYVASERDKAQPNTNFNTVLRYDPDDLNEPADPADPPWIGADVQWDLTDDLPQTADNEGVEGITWIPDSFLTSSGFVDSNGVAYNPADYGSHAGGVFFVSIEDVTEANHVFAFVLEDNLDKPFQGPVATRIATIATPNLAQVMGLEFDAGTGELWASCDDGCNSATSVLAINASGEFESIATLAAPDVISVSGNNEGFALAPTSECINGTRPALWGEDTDLNPTPEPLRQALLSRGC